MFLAHKICIRGTMDYERAEAFVTRPCGCSVLIGFVATRSFCRLDPKLKALFYGRLGFSS